MSEATEAQETEELFAYNEPPTKRQKMAHGNRHHRSKRANFGRLGRPTMSYSV